MDDRIATGSLSTRCTCMSVAAVEDGPADTISVTSAMPVRAKVHLGRLDPEDVVDIPQGPHIRITDLWDYAGLG